MAGTWHRRGRDSSILCPTSYSSCLVNLCTVGWLAGWLAPAASVVMPAAPTTLLPSLSERLLLADRGPTAILPGV